MLSTWLFSFALFCLGVVAEKAFPGPADTWPLFACAAVIAYVVAIGTHK